MDAKSGTNLLARVSLAAALLLGCIAGPSSAQNVYKDYVADRCSQYSPFDHQQRGLVYRMHTGHAGLFGNCDDDRQKMVSPYIDWHCRTPDRRLGLRFVNEMFTDIFRKSQRFADGAGACVIDLCHSCRQEPGDCHCQENLASAQQPHLNGVVARKNEYSTASKLRPTPGSYSSNPAATSFAITRQSLTSQVRTIEKSDSLNQNENHSFAFSARNTIQRSSANEPATNPYFRNSNKPSAQLAGSSQTEYSSRKNSLAYYSGIDQEVSRNVAKSEPTSTNQDAATRQGSIDPRFPQQGKLVPEDKFQFVEKEVRNERIQSRKDSVFQLSAGGVYNRPSKQRTAKANPPKPSQDLRSGPQYFQFQQIGGSKYR